MNALEAMGLGWVVLAGGFSAVALGRLLSQRRRAPGSTRVPVLLLRPVDVPTERELENLSRPIDYEGPLTHVVLSPQRPRLPEDVLWLRSDPGAPNRKVGHLLYALEKLPRDGRVVLVVDADVAVTGELVEGLAAPVAAGAALSTAVPTPVGERALADRAVAGLLRRTHHSFRALHVMSAGARAVCGKALGLSDRAVEELRALEDHIGEDLELSKRLHAKGLEVELCEVPAVVPMASGTWSAALARFTRWMQVLSSHRPGLYPTVPLLFTPTWPLLALSLFTGSMWLSAGVAGLLLVRTLLSWRLSILTTPISPLPPGEGRGEGAGFTSPGPMLWDWLLGEALLLAAFMTSLVRPSRVTWRGRTYALHSGGRMSPELGGGRG
ncbi:glycosyltransferase [Archangium violaceum]|uniref:Carotenoid biosynthesis protein n=1 Tax=Archangium violaceum Cb vi76 TaxID=1406225 RepID=A0A084SMG8_9BACT|nr:glycosyltransferase [Archangium violaceum]KFA89653.1 carotenoid biosynthesis protein [Archangium violaceum Cb vi76]